MHKYQYYRMNSFIIFTSVIFSIICVIFTYFQNYYLFYKFLRKPVIKYEVPLFDDLIPTDDTSLGYYSPDDDSIIEGLSAVLDPPKSYEKDNEQAKGTEVHNTLQAALAFHISGKVHKAIKLFEHAAAIAPADADVLNKYGEFLENTQKDVVTADELYFRALTYSPDHAAALSNRKRTAQVVDKLDSEMLKTIDAKRDILKELFSKDSFDNIKKQAYYLHIYHTIGIEGNTMTIDQLKYLLETGQVVSGKSIIEHNEVLGLQLAMKYVKLLTRKSYISVNDILGIHRRAMGHVDPVKSGRFRTEKVFIGKHIPPAAEEVPLLMEAYEYWLNSEEAQNMHPVRYAALAHYKLVDIHPFYDGNGRTSRLVMNLILIRAGYPPVMVLKEQREKYYDALNTANQGDVRPFVRFIAQSTIQILDMYMYGTEVMSIGNDEKEVINF